MFAAIVFQVVAFVFSIDDQWLSIRSCNVFQMTPVSSACQDFSELFDRDSICTGIGFKERPDKNVRIRGWSMGFMCEKPGRMNLIDTMCQLEAHGLSSYVFWPRNVSLCFGNI